MKENKIVLVLNDKETIQELALDKDVRIRIKDAIVDNIGRRTIKLINIDDELKSAIRRQIHDDIFTGTYTNSLKDEVKKAIRETVSKQISCIVDEEIRKALEGVSKKINEEIGFFKERAAAHLEMYDFNKSIKEAIDKEVKKRFS